jgi:hypothetical protein
MKATFYKKPHGFTEELEISEIYPEDEEFFTKYGIKLSMEEIRGEFVVYAESSYLLDDEPYELLVFSGGMSCKDTLQRLVETCKADALFMSLTDTKE